MDESIDLSWRERMVRWLKCVDWLTSGKAAIFVGGAAIIIMYLGSIAQHGSVDVHSLFLDLWSNGGTELASIALTVLVIDGLNRRRATKERQRALILQLGSPDNGFAQEAARILRSEGWLTNGTLWGANLWRANLAKAMLEDANLAKVTLRRALLMDANMRRINLMDANLWKANLEGAVLMDANLKKANLEEAILRGVDFRRANLLHTRFEKTNLRSADFRSSYLGYTIMSNADLGDANLEGIDFNRCYLDGANLLGANLKNAVFLRASLPGAILPDGTKYYPKTQTEGFEQLRRFTDPEHPQFWRPDPNKLPGWAKETNE